MPERPTDAGPGPRASNDPIVAAEALLRLDPGGPPDAGQAARRVIDRDRRRLRWLAGITVGIWLLAVLLLTAVVVLFFEAVAPKFKQAADDEGRRVADVVSYVVGLGAVAIAVAVGILATSTMATLLLVFASRRATLRQVNAGLAEMSEQLREIRRAMEAGRE